MQTICSYLEEEGSPKVKLKRPVVPMEEEKEKKEEEEESSPKVKLKRPVVPMEEEKEKKKEEEEQEKEEQQKEPEEEEDKEEELEVASRTGRLQQLLNSSVKVSFL